MYSEPESDPAIPSLGRLFKSDTKNVEGKCMLIYILYIPHHRRITIGLLFPLITFPSPSDTRFLPPAHSPSASWAQLPHQSPCQSFCCWCCFHAQAALLAGSEGCFLSCLLSCFLPSPSCFAEFGYCFVLPPHHPGPSLGQQVMPKHKGKRKAEGVS